MLRIYKELKEKLKNSRIVLEPIIVAALYSYRQLPTRDASSSRLTPVVLGLLDPWMVHPVVIGHRLVALMIRRVPVLTFRVDFYLFFCLFFWHFFFTFLEKQIEGHFLYIYTRQTATRGHIYVSNRNVSKKLGEGQKCKRALKKVGFRLPSKLDQKVRVLTRLTSNMRISGKRSRWWHLWSQFEGLLHECHRGAEAVNQRGRSPNGRMASRWFWPKWTEIKKRRMYIYIH